MKDDNELQINEELQENNGYSTKQRKSISSSKKSFKVLTFIFIILIFLVGVLYFLTRLTTGVNINPMESRVITLEEKVSGLEKRFEELQGGIVISAPDQTLLRQVEELVKRVEFLEKQKRPIIEQKPSPPSESKVSQKRQYHIVKKGETLYGISKKYRIGVEELRKINHLSSDQPLKKGQKLIIPTGH